MACGTVEAGRLAEAEACFEASLALWPQRSSTLFDLGAMRLRLGKHESALSASTDRWRSTPNRSTPGASAASR